LYILSYRFITNYLIKKRQSMKIIKIFEYEIDRRLLNTSEIARDSGYTQAYVSMLLDPDNKRKNENALRRILKSILKLYSHIVRLTERAA